MSPKVQMALLGSAIACLAIGLAAFVAIRNDYFSQTLVQNPEPSKPGFAADLSKDLDSLFPKDNDGQPGQAQPAALSPESCSEAGGIWNECGSLCRGKPAGTVCAQVCVPQCECTVGQSQCPAGYACVSDLSAGEGVCRSSQAPYPNKQANEFKSADGVTSVVVPNLALSNPFIFYGTSTAFENTLSWKLVQDEDKIVARGFMMVNSPDMGIPGDFQVEAYYFGVPRSASGTLIVYEASAKDGSPIHEVRIPVMLETKTTEVTVFWSNAKKDPGMLDCSKVYSFAKHKVVVGANIPLIAMHELLKGPMNAELEQGYSTNIPEGTHVPKLLYAEGKRPIIEFDETLEQGVAGSCRVSAIRAQIEKTFAANADTQEVPVISINGRTEDILQP
jgi:hypothetical protein